MNASSSPPPDLSAGAPAEPAGLELPPLTEGMLDDAVLAHLEADLASCTEVLGVLTKARSEGHVQPGAGPGLSEAFEQLRRREVRAIQVRYRYQGAEWWDSLLAQPGGYRLVRIQHLG